MSSHNIKGGNLGPILGAAMALGHNCWKGGYGMGYTRARVCGPPTQRHVWDMRKTQDI